jgi:hypothetical protein
MVKGYAQMKMRRQRDLLCLAGTWVGGEDGAVAGVESFLRT